MCIVLNSLRWHLFYLFSTDGKLKNKVALPNVNTSFMNLPDLIL